MFSNLNGRKLVIGCIHLLPLPGTPFFQDGFYEASLEKALKDAEALKEGGADGCVIQPVDRVFNNLDDTDYVRVTCTTIIGHEVKKLMGPDFYVGIQIMWNNITPSLAANVAAHTDFTRCSCLIGETSSPFGPLVGQPYKVMEYRRKIGAEKIEMLAEIAGYHFSYKNGYDKAALLENARQVMKVGANAIEVFDKDDTLTMRMVSDIKERFGDVPVILGGGTTAENVKEKFSLADGAIVGSYFENGNWSGPVHKDLVKKYVDAFRG